MFKRRKRTDAGAVVSDRDASRADLKALKEFVTTRKGVEAYLEPRTSVTQSTLLLIASDGEWTRKRIDSQKAAADFARSLKIPLYDANLVGYPQRMRDYNERQRGVSQPVARAQSSLTRDQLAAIMILESISGSDPVGNNPSSDDLSRLVRSARAKAHPDRNGGRRDLWDKAEAAAAKLPPH